MSAAIDRFLTDDASDVHLAVIEWIGAARVARNRREEIERALVMTAPETPPEVSAVPGPSAGRRMRIVELQGALRGHAFIACEWVRSAREIDAAGAFTGSRRRRFVGVEHRTFPLERGGALRSMLEACRAAFPESEEVRLYRRSGAGRDMDRIVEDSGAFDLAPEHSKRLLAAPVALIRSLAPPAHHEAVRVERVPDLSFYDEYAAHYNAMLAERPELAPEIPIESREAMASYLAEGLLCFLVIEGRRGGVMAARPAVLAGMHGHRVLEKFIYPEFRGRGYAAACQRRFVEALDPADGRILFGFIHPRNLSSLKAARGDARVDVGGYIFLPLR